MRNQFNQVLAADEKPVNDLVLNSSVVVSDKVTIKTGFLAETASSDTIAFASEETITDQTRAYSAAFGLVILTL